MLSSACCLVPRRPCCSASHLATQSLENYVQEIGYVFRGELDLWCARCSREGVSVSIVGAALASLVERWTPVCRRRWVGAAAR